MAKKLTMKLTEAQRAALETFARFDFAYAVHYDDKPARLITTRGGIIGNMGRPTIQVLLQKELIQYQSGSTYRLIISEAGKAALQAIQKAEA